MTRTKRQKTINRRDFLVAGVATTAAVAALSGNAATTSERALSDGLSEAEKDVRLFPNLVSPTQPVVHDPEVCIGCNTCVEICHQDIMIPNPEKGKPPVVVWPEECWQCGICVVNCPLGLEAKAIRLIFPLSQSVRWKRKVTGEHFRMGMVNPPAPVNRPPVGGYRARSRKS